MAKQLITLDGMAMQEASIACGTLVTFDDETAKRMLAANQARELLKHEPTNEQLGSAVSLDTSEKPQAKKPAATKKAE